MIPLVAVVALAGSSARAQETGPPSGTAQPVTAPPDALAREIEQLRAEQQTLRAEQKALRDQVAAQQAREAARAQAEASAPKPSAPPVLLGFGQNGFFLRTPDDSFQLRIRSVIQADGRAYLDDTLKQQDTFLIRRARLYIEGSVADFLDYRLMPDFAGGQVQLFDAWVNLRPWTWLQLRGGKMKSPFGLERLQSEQNLVFVERGLTSDLAPDRDIGASLHGDVAGKTFSWELGVFNGVPDGASSDQDNNYGKDFEARIFAHPFRPLHNKWIDEFGLGVAGTYGKQRGTATATGLSNFKTEGQLTFFSWLNDTKTGTIAIAQGDRWRVSPQLYYYVGPVSLQGEYVYTSTNVTTGVNAATIANQAWQLEVSGVLTGEHPTYDGLKPKRPFSIARRHIGAFELGLRVDELYVNDAAFPNFADPTKSARRATGVAAQFNWDFTANVRVALLYEHTLFKGGNGTGDRAPENAFLGRLQVAF
ncbi:MAG: OprO/OprP family phosphate-selective porin [Polyangia bacterium]